MLHREHGAVRRVASLQLQPWIFSQQMSWLSAVARPPRKILDPKDPDGATGTGKARRGMPGDPKYNHVLK
jgi:hypothetical protein